MATITIHWQASDQLRLAEIAQTGKGRDPHRTLTLDLTQVPAAQRTALLALTRPTGNTQNGEPCLSSIDISERPAPDTSAARLAERGMLDKVLVRLDAEPTLDQAISLAQEIAAERAALQAEADKITAEKRAAEAIIRTAADRAAAEIAALAAAANLAGLRAYRLPAEIGDAWTTTARAAADKLRQEIKTLEDAQREVDQVHWIAAHGSAHLKRCIAAGYNCKRLYVVERAAMEAPGFVVDFDNKAGWKDRSCPTPAALDAEDAARTLGLGEPLIVWLTEPPSDRVPDPEDYGDEVFDPCEAVVLRSYLGRYDLVQIVAGD